MLLAVACINDRQRLAESVETALKLGEGSCVALVEEGNDWIEHRFSERFACPDHPECALEELEPRLFSFNSRHGWCTACYGTGIKLTGFDWGEEREKTGTEEHVLDSWLEWLMGAYKESAPYVLAYVELEEGPRMLTNIVCDDPMSIRCGQPVKVRFDAAGETDTIPRFEPA